MKGDSYEIEIKSLLGDRAGAERLKSAMKKFDPKLVAQGAHRQLNHYFEWPAAGGASDAGNAGNGGAAKKKPDWRAVAKALPNAEDQKTFVALTEKAKDISLRTRDADGKVLLVFKAAIDDTTSANGTARREFEREVPLTLAELDAIILKAGFIYQAKWSREREEFKLTSAVLSRNDASKTDVNVVIDRNAGYGYLAEFEVVASDPSLAESIKTGLRSLMDRLGAEELKQDRLMRMFDYYNAHWPEYYGTEKIFVIQ